MNSIEQHINCYLGGRFTLRSARQPRDANVRNDSLDYDVYPAIITCLAHWTVDREHLRHRDIVIPLQASAQWLAANFE